jgi:hypothetical protein
MLPSHAHYHTLFFSSLSFPPVSQTCFASSCVVLKWKRPRLPRLVVSSPFTVTAALVLVVAGLVGNIVRQPDVMAWFILYFGSVVTVVFIMFNRTTILKTALTIAGTALTCGKARRALKRQQDRIVASHAEREQKGRAPSVVGVDLFAGTRGSLNGTSSEALLVKATDVDMERAGGASGGGKGTEGEGRDHADSTASDGALLLSHITAEEDLSGRTSCRTRLVRSIASALEEVNSIPYVFFAKAPDFETLNKAILYVRSNEQTSRLVVVHVVDDAEAVQSLRESWVKSGGSLPSPHSNAPGFERSLSEGLPPLPTSARLLREQVALLDAVYPKLKIDFLVVRGTTFGPGVIAWLTRYLGVGTNAMFIAMPDEVFPHQFAALGGVRVITRAPDALQRADREAHVLELLAAAAKEWEAVPRREEGGRWSGIPS